MDQNTHHLPDYDAKIMGYVLHDLYEGYTFNIRIAAEEGEVPNITENALEAAMLFQYAHIFDIPSLKGDALWDIKNRSEYGEYGIGPEGNLEYIEAMKIIFTSYKRSDEPVGSPNNIESIFWQFVKELFESKQMEELMKDDGIRGVICKNQDLASGMIVHLLPRSYPAHQ